MITSFLFKIEFNKIKVHICNRNIKTILKAYCAQSSWLYMHYFLSLLVFGYAGSSLLHRLFFSCGKWGLLFIEVQELLTVVASLVAEHRPNSCDAWAY